MEMNSLGYMLRDAAARLESTGASDPNIDAELMLLSLLGESRSYLFLHRDDPADELLRTRYERLVCERVSGTPVQYIIGSQEFMGLDFKVTEDVLIPRMDTETLVEWALEKASLTGKEISIMDMCCGSGAIAVSAAHFLPDAHVTACDISAEALKIAEYNAEINNTASRMDFVLSDMFDAEGNKFPGAPFDMILCNPPYIPTAVIGTLQREVREYEPVNALDGGADGLDFYRIIAEQAADYMKDGAFLLLEIGHDQAGSVSRLLEMSGKYDRPEIRKDLSGNDRVVCCRVNSKKILQND